MFEFDVDVSYMPVGAGADDPDELCWHPVNSHVPREDMDAEFFYVARLLARAGARVDVRELSVRAVTEEPCPVRKDIVLHRALLRLLHARRWNSATARSAPSTAIRVTQWTGSTY